jgi:PhzF family phenazine biosynthesis protein
MKNLAFKQVDVFTSVPFQGNPVAVVIGAEGLDTATMQRIANWTNLSETTFLLKSSVADYKLRIFTPRQELPFAGHPTLGSCHAAIESGFVSSRKSLTQECAAGIFDLTVQDAVISVRGPAPKMTPVSGPVGAEVISPPMRVDVGAVWVVAEVRDAATLAALRPDVPVVMELSAKLGLAGLCVFAPSGERESAIHVRAFAPYHGIPEDPVCGTGNLSVAAYLRHRKDGRFGDRYVARQGMQMGRDGRVFMRIDAQDGIHLGGNAVTCVEGTLSLTARG